MQRVAADAPYPEKKLATNLTAHRLCKGRRIDGCWERVVVIEGTDERGDKRLRNNASDSGGLKPSPEGSV